MIIATLKPLDELIYLLKQFTRVLVLGCNSCVTIGCVGGEENVHSTLSALKIGFNVQGINLQFDVIRCARQCEHELLEQFEIIASIPENYDAVLSFGCAVGVQSIAERTLHIPVIPALNTRFMGVPSGLGKWEIRCIGCGDCFLHLTGGVCVLARCPRAMQNGSCGFESDTGRCDVNPKDECVWDIIRAKYNEPERLLGQEKYRLVKPRNWSHSSGGGVTRVYDPNFYDNLREES